VYPEKSVKWLLKAYANLKTQNLDIQVVPVCINYDRLFDIRFLASEMISG